nr:retrovirus-related Pol polyprotein LINE-1 [Tanacetum cinerariifolium]
KISFFHKCTCELCGNGAHFGYNCPPKVSIGPDPEPFNNQTVDELLQTLPSFNPTCYSEDGNSFIYDSKSNLVHDSPNFFDPPLQPPLYSCEFYGNDARYDHYCTPQVLFIYPKLCYNQDFNFSQDFHDFQQQYLCCENYEVTHEAYQCQLMNEDYYHEQNSCYDPNSFGFDQFQPPQYTVNHPMFNAQNDILNSQNKLMEKLTSMCDMVGQYIQKKEEEKHIEEKKAAKYGDEHLDTILATESDEFIKPSAENLVLNPSESEDEYECDVPTYEVFTTFSNILFDAVYDFSSSDDQSFYNEDIPKKIYSNPLFDEEIISMKIDPYHFNAESGLIESLLNRDPSIISSFSKIDSLFDEFAGEPTLLKSIPSGINKTDCDPEEETRFIKRLLYDNPSPHLPEEFISEKSDTAFESFSPFPIPVEDSGSLMEEIDFYFTLDYPMSLGVEEDDYDSKGDILILEEFLNSDSLSLLENESFDFDILSFSRPPAKPPDGNTRILNVKVMGDISEHKCRIEAIDSDDHVRSCPSDLGGVAEGRHKVDITCFQETKWKGSRAREGNGYKLWRSDRIMAISVVIEEETVNVISAYAPQVGLRGDLNGHIGVAADGYAGVHEGFRAFPGEACSSQHRLIIVDVLLERLQYRREVTRRPKILWKNLNGEVVETFRAIVSEKLVMEDMSAMAKAKDKPYEDLYKKFDSKEGVNDIYKIDKARERRRRDIGNTPSEKSRPEGSRKVGSSNPPMHYDYYYSRINQREVRATLQKMGRNKAVCLDQIPIEAWRLSEVIPIYKNRGDVQECSNYRGIKLWERVIERRLRRETRVLENQFGFMPGRSTTEGIQKNIPWCMIFADDIMLIAESAEGLNNRLESLRKALEDNGLRVSREKMEYLRCDFDRFEVVHQEMDIHIGDQILQPNESFRYLGSVLHRSGWIYEDVAHRIRAGWIK